MTIRNEQPPAIRAVLFDLGGVILRTDDPAPRTALANRFGINRGALEDIVFNSTVSREAEEGRATAADVWADACRALHLPFEDAPELRREFFAGDRVDFTLVDLIRALRGAYRTGLLSNGWYPDLPRFLVEDLQIPEDTFDVVVSSAAVKIAKPNPGIYQIAVDRLGTTPAETVFVDDNERNIEAALDFGLQVIRFTSTEQTIEALRSLIPLP